MFICTNCLAKQTENQSICTVCRMPGQLRAIPERSNTNASEKKSSEQTESRRLCSNCADELPEKPVSHCPGCRFPAPIPVAPPRETVFEQLHASLGEAKSDTGLPEIKPKQRPLY